MERFARGVPLPPPLPTAAWINKPTAQQIACGEPSVISALAVPDGVES